MKARFTVNPFEELNLTELDQTSLKDLANQYMDAKLQVDLTHWKPLKDKDSLKVYSERPEAVAAAVAAGDEPTGAGLLMILCVGTKPGKLDDLMYGVTNEDLETMRLKASYVNDFSGAAVLEFVVLPSLEDPFQSLVVKWMELDIPFSSTSLVKNRDYVYLEGTGFVTNARGERLGYHVLHSVSFPQTHSLPNRVRGNISLIGFWRQTGKNTMELYATGIMDPVNDGLVRKLVVPNMATLFLSSLRYAHCGRMRKLAFMLEQRYQESKTQGTPNKESVCVTCSSQITGRRLGDFGKSNSTCKLCFGFVCSNCKIVQKLSFVDADLLLSQRKVTFCSKCISEVLGMSAVDVARASLLGKKKHQHTSSSIETALTSGGNSSDFSYASN
ncbi:hypothetical protein PHYSODRAFT_332802 [Phytophthora sojae]|uniref:FYVE-type domain-containing protein n=1 Tax=Phytophthora sojae (strain P6497) TaxID=1094619 RepID=G4ZQ22_PHYSP|nr:hypothetical protein PHYSODRAFT_332802 [Phytophthora sojae]EGZ14411.1 hypothetical protein PHYSODRAFT_332802 [Phytophthora sojae]|eukprot:XP_009528160.1 hypothetical protein PHYSODRAFT_332802 [Phytophthora sojae]